MRFLPPFVQFCHRIPPLFAFSAEIRKKMLMMEATAIKIQSKHSTEKIKAATIPEIANRYIASNEWALLLPILPVMAFHFL